MKLKLLCFIAFTATTNLLHAQTLFTYGSHAVSKKEFLEAYYKNPDTTGNKTEKLKQYYDLYVNFRLKLQAAYDEKANNNAELKSEADNFKSQLTENYINQQADINLLMHEAFVRSQKDILVEQVFVKFSGVDTTNDYAQISKAYEALKSGKNFEDVSVQYSTDSAVKAAKGNVGYITVFTLPYSIENIIYGLKPGGFSSIYKSKVGYHIFKNVSERNAIGRRKIEQLLFNTPSFLNTKQVDSVKHVADSVYTLLQKGTPFISLAPIFGHNNYDLQSANAFEVGAGDYSDDFEKGVFEIKQVGDASKPFKTAYGYNIIKLNQIMPVAKDENDVTFMSYLQTQIQNDGRLNTAKYNLVDKWFSKTGFKENAFNHNDLWLYSDSALSAGNNLPASVKNIKPETVLFHFTKKNITVKDWINYLHSDNVVTAQADYAKKFEAYKRTTCDAYYHEHIEDFDTAAIAQIKEFNEANMLFYVMDKHVWSKASNDSAGLKKFYNAHKADYMWKQSISALVISAPEKIIADSIALKIKDNPGDWRNIVAPYNNSIYADSNRFETDQLPIKEKIEQHKDFQTTPEPNEAGDSYTFIHVMNVYNQPEPRSFDDAKGIVINDYQQELESLWINNLKTQYPVKLNEAVYKTLQ